MNYIELINRFWLVDLEASFSHLETRLYFKLLEISNRLGWPDGFKYPNSRLEAEVGTRTKNLIQARQRLIDHGLISYKKGTTRNAGNYRLLSTLQSFEPTKESNQESNLGTNQGSNGKVIRGTLIKQNKTKDNTPKVPKKRKPRKQPEVLEFPFASDRFKETWEKLLTMPKWKKKLNLSLQMALNKLGKYHEDFAIDLMERAIEGNYQGVAFPDTDEKYSRWLKKNKPQTTNSKNVNDIWNSQQS